MSLKCCSSVVPDPAAELVPQIQPCIGLGPELVQQQDLDRIFQRLGELLVSSKRIESTIETLQISRRRPPSKHSTAFADLQLSNEQACRGSTVYGSAVYGSTVLVDASDVSLEFTSPRPPRPHLTGGSSMGNLDIDKNCEGDEALEDSIDGDKKIRPDAGWESDRPSRPCKVSFGGIDTYRNTIATSRSGTFDIDCFDVSSNPSSPRLVGGASTTRLKNISIPLSWSSNSSSYDDCCTNESRDRRDFNSRAMDTIGEESKDVTAMSKRQSSDRKSSGPQTLMLPVSWPASIKLRQELDTDAKREIEELLRVNRGNSSTSVLRVLSSRDFNGDTSPGNITHVKSLHHQQVHEETMMSPIASTPSATLGLRRFDSVRTWSGMLNPSSHGRILLDFLSVIVLCFDMLATPLVLAWDVQIKPDSHMNRIFWATCIFWTCDIFVNFRTGFYNHGNLEMRPSKVAWHYCRTWLLPDAIIVLGDWTSLLMPIIVGKTTSVSTMKLLRFSKAARMFRLLGVLRMAKLAELFDRIMQMSVLEKHQMLIQIPPLLLVVFWVNHLICCMWFAIGRLAPSDTGLRWIDQLVADDSGVTYRTSKSVYQYATAFHWSLAQMTPGSMQVNASNTCERTYNNFCLVLGVICYSSLISLITSKMTHIKVMRQHKSTSLSTLRRFLRQNELPKVLRIAVQKQIVDRMKKPKLLTVNDVDALSMLSLSLRTRLQYELCRPAIESHPLFFLIDKISNTVLHHLCKDATEFLVLAPGDNLFLPGTEAESAYVLMRGGLRYMQEPSSSKVAERTVHDISPDSSPDAWLCEVALWAHWTHVGTVEGISMSELLVINATRFTKSLHRHGIIWQLTQEYAQVFHKRLVSCHLASTCFPSDWKRPFEDYNELFTSMSTDIKVFIGLLTIELMQKSPWFSMLRRGTLSSLREQVISGTCTLGLGDGNQVVRIVEVAALRLLDNDGCIFVHLGQIKNGVGKGRCQLPGAKVIEGEMPDATIKRVMQEKLRPMEHLVDIVSSDLEVTMKDSVSFQVSTKYLKTVYKGMLRDLKDGEEVPGKSTSNKATKVIAFKSKTKSKMSFLSAKETGTWSSFNRFSTMQLPDVKDLVFSDAGDITYVCGWVLEHQLEQLASSSGSEVLSRWIKNLPQINDNISPSSTGASSRPTKTSTQKLMRRGSQAGEILMKTIGIKRSVSSSNEQ